MKKYYIFSIINLIAFIICNIFINYTDGGINILFTVFFFISWYLALIGIYFILHEHVKENMIGDIDNIRTHEFDVIINYLDNDFISTEVYEILGDKINLSKRKIRRYAYDKLLSDNNLSYKKSNFFSYQNEHISFVYLSYSLSIILFLFGILSFLSYHYFNRYGLVQYENFSIINGVILVSQPLIRILIDSGIIRKRIS